MQAFYSLPEDRHFFPSLEEGQVGPPPQVEQDGKTPFHIQINIPVGRGGQIFKRVVVARLVGHLSRDSPDLHTNQYDFRQGRSTVDAIIRVRSLTGTVTKKDGMVLAISFNIANAFNILLWDRMGGRRDTTAFPPTCPES